MQILDRTESRNIILGEEVFRFFGNGGGLEVYKSNDIIAYLEPAESAEEALQVDKFVTEEAGREHEDKCSPECLCFPAVMEERDPAGETKYFFFTVMPKGQKTDCTVSLEKAATKADFAVYPRLLAAMRLCEAVTVIAERFGSDYVSIHPEDIYVNTKNGQVFLILRKWLTAGSGS